MTEKYGSPLHKKTQTTPARRWCCTRTIQCYNAVS